MGKIKFLAVLGVLLLLLLGNCENIMVPEPPLRNVNEDGSAAVTGVTLDFSEMALTLTESRQLTATISPSHAANQALNWMSLNAGVASVSQTGLVRAVSAGTAVIWAISEDGGKIGVCTVTVSALVGVTGLTAVPGNGEIALSWTLPAAEGFDYVVISASPPEGNLSSETTVNKTDTPNNAFLATGLTNGVPYTISLKAHYESGLFSGNTSQTVTPVSPVVGVTGITLDYSLLSLTPGAVQLLTAGIAPADATNQGVSWSSSNPGAATVDASGLVTAGSGGTTVVMAITEDGNKIAACTVTVTAQPNVTNFTGAAGNKQIALSWTNPGGADFEKVLISASPNQGDLSAPRTILKTASPNNSFTATGLGNGVTYTVTIRAYYTGGDSSGDNSLTVTTIDQIPPLDLSPLIPAPVTGTIPASFVSLPDQYSEAVLAWKTGSDAAHTGAFLAGQIYKAVLTLDSASGYAFGAANPYSYTGVSINYQPAGDTDATLTLTFPPTLPVSVSGTVTDSAGPLGSAVVKLTKSSEFYNQATTAPDGSYSLSGLDAGTYDIEISKEEHFTWTDSFTVTTSNVSKNAVLKSRVTELDLSSLIAPPVLAALLPSPNLGAYTQFAGASVIWEREAAPDTWVAHTGDFQAGQNYRTLLTLTAKTAYSFEGVSSFTHSTALSIGSPLFEANDSVAKLTLSFNPTDKVSVSGAITAYGGSPLGGATVQLMQGGNAYLDPVNTGPDGTYVIEEVPGGTYTLAVSKSGYGPVTTGSVTVTTANVSKNVQLPQQVNQLNLVGIWTPVLFSPPNSVPALSSAQNEQYSAASGSWTTAAGAPFDIFEPETVYKLSFTLIAKPGWTFGSLNADSFPAFSGTQSVSAVIAGDGGAAEITLTFSPLAAPSVQEYTSSASYTLVQIFDDIQASNNPPGTSYTIHINTSETDTSNRFITLNVSTHPNLANTRITLRSSVSSNINRFRLSLTGSSDGKITVVLDSESLEIRGLTDSPAITVGSNAAFILKNGKIGEGRGIEVQGGTFTMEGGELHGSTNLRGVAISDGGVFTMTGGTISNYSGMPIGGGVYVNGGTFTMTGGTIYKNSATSNGGGVYINTGTFTMRGGTIGDPSNPNAAPNGGGVYNQNGTFIKTGGLIYGRGLGNTSPSGSAIFGGSDKSRNATAGPEDSLDSRVSGSAGGWE